MILIILNVTVRKISPTMGNSFDIYTILRSYYKVIPPLPPQKKAVGIEIIHTLGMQVHKTFEIILVQH